MKFKEIFEKSGFTGLKIKASFLEMEWKPNHADENAAWELYIELLTRVTTQALDKHEGTEEAALESVHSIFKTTRDILKHHGRACVAFSKVAIIILNQIIRPFTSKWHQLFKEKEISDDLRMEFRDDLENLQIKLISYTHMLAKIASVEDITDIEA